MTAAGPNELAIWLNLLDTQRQSDATGDGTALLQAADEARPHHANDIAQLRKHWPAEDVRIALELVQARRKAARKFPDCHTTLVADSSGLAQASSALIADYKADQLCKRLGGAIDRPVVDLCCGIGGDAMSLGRVCPAGVVAIDIDPLYAWMARRNANCASVTADITTLAIKNRVFHLDPARRNASGRLKRFADYQPGPDYIRKLLEKCPTGMIKLGPGIDHEELHETLQRSAASPGPSGVPFELEFISERGALAQAVLWTGDAAAHARRATHLPSNTTLAGEVGVAPWGPPEQYLYTVDAAVERAQLLGLLSEQTATAAIHPALGILTSNKRITHAFLTAFELQAEMPWRVKGVKQWLRHHDAGVVEVKTRGKAVEPDMVAKQLRGKGDTPWCVFVVRFDRQVKAFITRRLGADAE